MQHPVLSKASLLKPAMFHAYDQRCRIDEDNVQREDPPKYPCARAMPIYAVLKYRYIISAMQQVNEDLEGNVTVEEGCRPEVLVRLASCSARLQINYSASWFMP